MSSLAATVQPLSTGRCRMAAVDQMLPPGIAIRPGTRTGVRHPVIIAAQPGVAAALPPRGAYVPTLTAAGYRLTIREPYWHEHRLFKGPDTNVNVREHPEDIDRYAETKLRLVHSATDIRGLHPGEERRHR
jgi:hypothetical protein